jgi:hypothetical protein
MKTRIVKILMPILFIGMIYLAQALYQFFGEGKSIPKILTDIEIDLSAIFVVSAFSLIVLFVFAIIYSYIRRK